MITKKIFLMTTCLVSVALQGEVEQPVAAAQKESTQVELSREQTVRGATPIILGLVGTQSSTLKELGSKIASDIGYSGQCKVTIRAFDDVQKKDVMQKLFDEGFLLAAFVLAKDKNSFEVRLYDTAQKTMLLGKRFTSAHEKVSAFAHSISDVLWKALTGQQGIFSTKIAYCKKETRKKGMTVKHIYMCDYDGSNEERIIDTPTINVAPRWNRDVQHPRIFYSEYTNENVRLMVVNMRKQRKIVSNFDGITMVPSFASDGKAIVYCASRGKGSCQIFMVKEGKVTQLTDNTGNNVSPVFSHDGLKVFFCSDYETGLPQICTYRLSDGAIERITTTGYCASPACSMRHNKVAYAKIVDGVMQIMLYDPLKKTHAQITFGSGNKEECCWSPCGNYLVYSHEDGTKGSLVSLNMQTNKGKVLTSSRDVCSYPAWSPVYERIPSIEAA